MNAVPRIVGTELEWALHVKNQPDDEFRPLDNFNHLREELRKGKYLPNDLYAIDEFLSNGARNYVDVGPHLEYATPEDTSFESVVTSEIAGERISEERLRRYAMTGRGFVDFRLNKRLVDQSGVTWGHHENYSTTTPGMLHNQSTCALFGLYLATRNVWAGAGQVRLDPSGKPHFLLSQKNTSLNYDITGGTTNDHKGIINTRDEPHADSTMYERIHVTSGEANMSPFAMWLTLGSASIVLRLMESHYFDPADFIPKENLVDIAWQVSHDGSLRVPIELDDGRTILPIEVQQRIVDLAYQLDSDDRTDVVLTDEEYEVLGEWQRIIDDLTKSPESTVDRLDWTAKHQLLRADYERKGHVSVNNWVQIDRLWGEISPRGIGLKLRNSQWNDWMPTEEDIRDAIILPPDTTRAQARADFIYHYAKRRRLDPKVCGWQELYLDDKRVAYMTDPYRTKLPKGVIRH